MINWQENLPSSDIPEEWMWPFDEVLEEWFEDLSDRRKNPESGDDEPMTRNELARDRGD